VWWKSFFTLTYGRILYVKSPDKSARRDHNSRKQPAAGGSSHARTQRVNGHPKGANRSPRAS